MTKYIAVFVCGAIWGIAGIEIIMRIYDLDYLKDAQMEYSRCIEDGAPSDKCLVRYLLPPQQEKLK